PRPGLEPPGPGALRAVVPHRAGRIRGGRAADHRCDGGRGMYNLREGGSSGNIQGMAVAQTTGTRLRLLGQSGCRIAFPGCTVYVDPYLSHCVEALDAPDLVRLVPVPVEPAGVRDADWVLVTHDHIDHCDPHTLPALAAASPGARFMGPAPVADVLAGWGIPGKRIVLAREEWLPLSGDVRIHAVPAAHPEIARDAAGNLACVGYVIEHAGRRSY